MYFKILNLLQKLWHSHAQFWGRNETEESSARKCVVISPHPDDETIAMGATLARKCNSGTPVVLIVATDGRHSQNSKIHSKKEMVEMRKTELLGATSILGINEDDIYFMEEEDGNIDDNRLEIEINKIIDGLDFTPEEVMSTSWFDGHQDHQACARIARQIANERGIELRCAPVYWWAQGPSRFHRENHTFLNRQLGKFLDLKRAFFERGFTVDVENFDAKRKQALKHYASQLTNITGEENWSTIDKKWLSTFDRKREFFTKQ